MGANISKRLPSYAYEVIIFPASLFWKAIECIIASKINISPKSFRLSEKLQFTTPLSNEIVVDPNTG